MYSPSLIITVILFILGFSQESQCLLSFTFLILKIKTGGVHTCALFHSILQ